MCIVPQPVQISDANRVVLVVYAFGHIKSGIELPSQRRTPTKLATVIKLNERRHTNNVHRESDDH